MLLVLTGITVLSVAILAYFNELTKEPIAQANMKILNDALMSVVPGFDNNPVADSDTIYKMKGEVKTVDFIIYPAKRWRVGGDCCSVGIIRIWWGYDCFSRF